MKKLMEDRERIKKYDKNKILEFRYRKSIKLQKLKEFVE